MPELPEVETVRRGLAPAMEGQVIARAEVNRPDLRWPFPERMAERLTGQRVGLLRRRSKYILADLEGGESLLVHLGMSGRMLVSGDPLGQFQHNHPAPEKHDHVVLHMGNGARITFNDPRRFGAMDLMPTAGAETHKLLASLGPEPLGNDFHEAHLVAKLKGRNTPIKSALLDQRIVAGLGNIYVCEALWQAGIHPRKAGGKVTMPQLRRLVPAIKDVLTRSIEDGGSTLRDFAQPDGNLGYFATRFHVYGREGDACHRDDGGTVRRIVQGGRSTWFCPLCQK